MARRRVPRKTSGACPAFFKMTCAEARRGGGHGYVWAGRKLLGCAAGLIAADTDEDLTEIYEELTGLIRAHNDDGVLDWFDRQLPRCMELIPRRRRASFLAGVYTEVEEFGVPRA
jgi:hypothetical protein